MFDNFFRNIIDFFIPPKCAVCKELSDNLICDSCKAGFIPITEPFCKKCGMPLDISEYNDSICADCRGKEWHFERAVSAGVFTGTLREAVLNLKYNDMVRTLSQDLAKFMIDNITLPENIDYFTPVPIHKNMEKVRGYNQSILIAGHLSAHYEIPVIVDLIQKVTDTPLQHFLTREQRQSNINKAFKVDFKLKDENIAIIDDVFTTGMTADACARALKRAGAKNVYVLSVARAVSKDFILKYKQIVKDTAE